jgi:hypothetical protein
MRLSSFEPQPPGRGWAFRARLGGRACVVSDASAFFLPTTCVYVPVCMKISRQHRLLATKYYVLRLRTAWTCASTTIHHEQTPIGELLLVACIAAGVNGAYVCTITYSSDDCSGNVDEVFVRHDGVCRVGDSNIDM